MSKLEHILEYFPDETFMKMDGYDDAVLGVDESSMRLIYSKNQIIHNLNRDMPIEDAIEFFDYNIAGAYVGEQTPIICNDYLL